MYYVYVLRCEDGSLYTGIAADWRKRFAEHMSGGKKCAKYTKVHRPVCVEAVWSCDGKSDALKTEHFIKTLTKAKKEQLVKSPDTLSCLTGLSVCVINT